LDGYWLTATGLAVAGLLVLYHRRK
jgi:LPXTG-motif cell wall-anchored protein